MTRNVKKQAEQGRQMLNGNRSLSMDELEQLINLADNPNALEGILDAVVTAFYMGAATGIRQGQQA